jgi:hypothetical protein
MKQPHAQEPLGFLDLLGERGRRDLQRIGRAREMKVLRYADDTADMPEFELPHSIASTVNYRVIVCQ